VQTKGRRHFRILVWKRSLRSQDTFAVYLMELDCEGVNCINLAQDSVIEGFEPAGVAASIRSSYNIWVAVSISSLGIDVCSGCLFI
jgi:hypothetical protein